MSEALSPAGVPRIYGDVPPFMAFPYVRDLAGLTADAVVVGMPYDGIATFRGGATRRAPQEIRKYSLLYGSYSLDWDLDMLAHIAVADAGDIDVVPGDNTASYARLEARLASVLAGGAVPLTIGGDRLTRASPLLRIAELDKVDPRRIVVIGARGPRNLPEWTPLYRKLGITVFPMEEVERLGIETVAERARAIASADGARLYISLDIDGVDPAFAPATNSPEPGGLTSREIIRGVRIAARNGFAGFDLVEVSPDFDASSGTTSILAGRLLAEALFCMAARRAGREDAWREAHKTRA